MIARGRTTTAYNINTVQLCKYRVKQNSKQFKVGMENANYAKQNEKKRTRFPCNRNLHIKLSCCSRSRTTALLISPTISQPKSMEVRKIFFVCLSSSNTHGFDVFQHITVIFGLIAVIHSVAGGSCISPFGAVVL